MTVRRESGDLCGASEGDMNGVNKLIIQQHLIDIEHDFKAGIFYSFTAPYDDDTGSDLFRIISTNIPIISMMITGYQRRIKYTEGRASEETIRSNSHERPVLPVPHRIHSASTLRYSTYRVNLIQC